MAGRTVLPMTEQTTQPAAQTGSGWKPEIHSNSVSLLTLWGLLVDCPWLQAHHLDIYLRLAPCNPV